MGILHTMFHPNPKPVVLCISGHDPCGGAGIQADIEAVAAQGAHAATLITCLTVQDSSNVYEVLPVQPAILLRQATRIAKDYPVAAIKIGLIGSAETANALQQIRQLLPDIPLVLDTVLASGGGQGIGAAAYLEPLIPLSTLLTPNRREARELSGGNTPDACGAKLLQKGCGAVLITGADESSHGQVTNTLYRNGETRHWQWPKLPGDYHGSGCTLAAAIAAQLALGEPLTEAIARAQAYTWESLQQGFRPGSGQFIPDRIRP
ncbi:bifunctional hydroxymethylpyrimidine kinase/phosphomethylpyrimidine kinase [Thiolapillus sp.]|uniref:bifunctional hydroxymethylpyrimidine kinase/phosphomethylpyrimidine kinase n=3 Tax=Thiolapillus sp. TaxID=2017437 RepID=UPI0025D6B629|nr:hydroxymethylpyrimidine/phosphomethylpyrimidine kinase [Thiolapillus sp.]